MQATDAIVTAPNALGAATNALGRATNVLGRATNVLGRAPIVLVTITTPNVLVGRPAASLSGAEMMTCLAQPLMCFMQASVVVNVPVDSQTYSMHRLTSTGSWSGGGWRTAAPSRR